MFISNDDIISNVVCKVRYFFSIDQINYINLYIEVLNYLYATILYNVINDLFIVD